MAALGTLLCDRRVPRTGRHLRAAASSRGRTCSAPTRRSCRRTSSRVAAPGTGAASTGSSARPAAVRDRLGLPGDPLRPDRRSRGFPASSGAGCRRTWPRCSRRRRRSRSSILLFANVGILIGPFLLMAIRQIKAYEPGDANWGVKLEHVRGQEEAKEEITRVINLWQAGDEFKKAGGKPERGLLFLGSPGTGKTMLAKAHRDRVQLAVRDRPGLRLRGHVHRHGHPRRAVPRLEGQEARAQVGRPVHRLHRRDRRGRHAPQLARRRRLLAARRFEQHPRPPVLRSERRADRVRRRDVEVVRVARADVRRARRHPGGGWRAGVPRHDRPARPPGPSTSPSRA